MSARKFYDILLSPILTEKSAFMATANWYAFEVAPYATKPLIAQAIEKVYAVEVEAVNVVNKRVRRERTAKGVMRKIKAVKKAYIRLKSGQTINTGLSGA